MISCRTAFPRVLKATVEIREKPHPIMKPPEPTDVKVNPSLVRANDEPVSRTWVMVTPVGSSRLAKVTVSVVYFVLVASMSVLESTVHKPQSTPLIVTPRNEARGLSMYGATSLSDIASLEAYILISLVVGSFHETTPNE